jgi:hypothetical protein
MLEKLLHIIVKKFMLTIAASILHCDIAALPSDNDGSMKLA